MFSNGTGQLCNLDLALVVPFEAREHHLPLSWLQPVDERWNGSLVVGIREQDQLFIDKLVVRDHLCVFTVQVNLKWHGTR